MSRRFSGQMSHFKIFGLSLVLSAILSSSLAAQQASPPQAAAGKEAAPPATPAPQPSAQPSQTPPLGQPKPDEQQAQPQQNNSPQAQAKTAAQQPPKQLVGTTTGWVRVCQKVRDTEKEGCSIKQDVVAENGAFLASLAVQEVTGEQRRQLIVTTPLGMALQAGLLVRIDNEKAVPAKFGTCLVNGCFAGLEINTDL
ncbi:MAG: invasion associated locus B family protein, partial [Pseudomonadota bacterium]